MFGRGFTGIAPNGPARMRRLRLISAALTLILLVVVTAFVLAPQLITYLSGTPTTAHVDGCQVYHRYSRHSSTTCYGYWTLNGVRHSGEIQGAGVSDEGEDIPVHATEDSAATEDTLSTTWFTAGIVLVVGVIGIAFSIIRRRRFRGRPPYGPSPYGPGGPFQPGPYVPGPYQQGPPPGPGPYPPYPNQQGPYQPGPPQPGPRG